MRYVENSWQILKCEDDLHSYYEKRLEISMENKVLMWGHRVITRAEFRKQLLNEMHAGIVKCEK